MDYIRSIDGKGDSSCFLCDAAKATEVAELRERLVLWSSAQCVVVINRYPYTNGHLLIAPRAHLDQLDDLPEEIVADLARQTARAIKLLKRALSPQGFNIGINLGRCAGAGLPGHVHQHVVPRWNGDTNFMSVVGEVRVVPQAMTQLWEELRQEIQHDQ
jgi:ATP adenylyltransferase